MTAYALHPGVVASDIWRRVPRLARPFITRRMLTTEQGAVTSRALRDVARGRGGQRPVLRQVRGQEPSPVATPELAELLWKRSAEWTGAWLSMRLPGGAAPGLDLGRR